VSDVAPGPLAHNISENATIFFLSLMFISYKALSLHESRKSQSAFTIHYYLSRPQHSSIFLSVHFRKLRGGGVGSINGKTGLVSELKGPMKALVTVKYSVILENKTDEEIKA
jgi:hypothetical protein